MASLSSPIASSFPSQARSPQENHLPSIQSRPTLLLARSLKKSLPLTGVRRIASCPTHSPVVRKAVSMKPQTEIEGLNIAEDVTQVLEKRFVNLLFKFVLLILSFAKFFTWNLFLFRNILFSV